LDLTERKIKLGETDQFDPEKKPQEPDWKELRKECLELWARSKHLRLAMTLSVAVLKTDGLPGFRQSLWLLKGMIEQYWDSFFPPLDPADNNDPTERVNIIASLATPVASLGDDLKFLQRLREAPLAISVQMGKFGLADILASEAGQPGPDGKPAPSSEQIGAAFRDTTPEQMQALNQAVTDSISLARGIDELLTKTVGADRAPDLSGLTRELKDIQKRMAPYLPSVEGAVAPGPDGQAAPTSAGPARQAISGDIQSSDDVVKMLDKICQYYKQQERSSPVPKVLERVKRLAVMDFMDIIKDLSPDSVKEIQKITGEKSE